jgi:cyclopropane-fatty-acyl-phospholipid synthase
MPRRPTTTLTDAVVDREWLADPVLRTVIRRRVAARLRRAHRGPPTEWAARRAELLATRAAGPVTRHADAANDQHYEVPTEFYELLLGPRLKYSSGYWPDGVEDLARAEEAMLALTATRAGLADGQRVLDLGCGWGALALWVAARYPGSEVTAVSNSATQRVHIEKQAADRGLDNLQVVTTDVADLAFPDGSFDRVVSVEMFEHVANHRALLARIAGWLAPGGWLFVHVFSHRDAWWEFDHQAPQDWMARWFFTGGILPSDDLLLHEQRDLAVIGHWVLGGDHYQRTLEAWLDRLDAHRGEADALLDPRAVARWRVFLLASAEMFGFRRGTEFGVSHYLFARGPTG